MRLRCKLGLHVWGPVQRSVARLIFRGRFAGFAVKFTEKCEHCSLSRHRVEVL